MTHIILQFSFLPLLYFLRGYTLKNAKDIGLKRFLRSTKWFSFTSVIVLFISMGILILIGIHKLVVIIKDIFVLGINNLDAINMNIVSARIISIIDIYLLVIVLYILAIDWKVRSLIH